MSSTPASARGWLPTTPTGVAAEPREAADEVLGPALVDLEELAVVDDPAHDHRFMSYGLAGSSGMSVSSSASSRSTADRTGSAYGGGSRLFCGRNESR